MSSLPSSFLAFIAFTYCKFGYERLGVIVLCSFPNVPYVLSNSFKISILLGTLVCNTHISVSSYEEFDYLLFLYIYSLKSSDSISYLLFNISFSALLALNPTQVNTELLIISLKSDGLSVYSSG